MIQYIIYMARNKVSGKCYIGKTSMGLAKRMRGHFDYASRRLLTRNSSIFHKALSSYGKDAFEWTILEAAANHDELNALEIKFINKYNTQHPNGYNMTAGGGGMYGYSMRPETRKELSEKIKALHQDPEYRAKLYPKLLGKTPPNKGKPMSETQVAKMTAVAKARYADPTYVNPNVGQKRTGEALANLHASYETRQLPTGDAWTASHANQYTPEVRAKMRAAKLGKKPHNTKRVQCIETGEIFDGVPAAAKALGIDKQGIYCQIKGRQRHAGGKTFRYLD